MAGFQALKDREEQGSWLTYRVIGTPVERVDGPEMLFGQALYGPDVSCRACCGEKFFAVRFRMEKFCASMLKKREIILA